MTYNYGVDSYDIGEGFGHFGVALPDVYKAAETIKSGGGEVRVVGIQIDRHPWEHDTHQHEHKVLIHLY